jgi:hypothetical protein
MLICFYLQPQHLTVTSGRKEGRGRKDGVQREGRKEERLVARMTRVNIH